MHALPVLTPAQAADWDRRSEALGIPVAVLMESAGRAVVHVLLERFATRARHGVLVACGPGHNGGDGWVVARALHRAGVSVWVVEVLGPTPSSLSRHVAHLARMDGVRTVETDGPWPAVGLIVDGLLGTGARGPLRGPLRTLVDRLHDLALPVVAVDGPTGLDLLDGVQHGPLRADCTVTFGGYRRGHLLARDDIGDALVVDIGLPPPDPAWPKLFTETDAAAALSPFPARTHKGTRGRVVIVGGDVGMTGAARLAARAAFAAGAGLVHVAAPAESVRRLASAEPDVQVLEQEWTGTLTASTREALQVADAVVVGPGLGRGEHRGSVVEAVLECAQRVVLDADGLTAFVGHRDRLADLLRGRPAVLTPHLGEFRALCPEMATLAAVDPWTAAGEAASLFGCTVLLKGVPTVIAAMEAEQWTVAAGNSGLATGGSGDLLSGLIGTMMAQGHPPPRAAALGALALGSAADHAARRTSARSLRPMEVVTAFAEVWRDWRARHEQAAPVRYPVLHMLPRPLG